MTFRTSIVLPALSITWAPAHALLLCAKVTPGTAELKEGSVVKPRVECKTKKDGTPTEVAIKSTEELAEIRGKADVSDLADLARDVATNMARIELNSGRLDVLETFHPDPTPTPGQRG